MNNGLVKYRIFQLTLVAAILATYVISPWRNFDPISLPKMTIVSALSFSGFFLLARNFALIREIHYAVKAISVIFLLGLTLPLLFSESPIHQQIWGVFGRNTGYLTYVSLLCLMILSCAISQLTLYHRIPRTFILSSIPMTIYCIVQILKLDPVGWSEFNTFGTLGNINFLSAYLGLVSVAAYSLLLDSKEGQLRIICLLLLLIDIPIVLSTGSIQGFMIFLAGSGITTLYFLLHSPKLKILFWPTMFLGVLGVVLSVLGLGNAGPLARFIFQPSVLFRGDYMHAGLELSISHPLFGVGLDSYGDWYRQSRGEISTLRTGPDRISNTAHNIFLDISSTAGLLAGLSYVSLVLLTGFWAALYLKKSKRYSGRDVALVSCWFAYQIQALVSINQIGVGVWGWIFTGAILGLVRIGEKERKDGLSAAQARGKMLNASSSLSALIGLGAGLLVAFAPLRADIEFRSAQVNGEIEQMRDAALSTGGTAWHLTLTLDYAIRSGNESFAYETAEILVERYPRDFFGWRVLETSPISTQDRVAEARLKSRELDPFNPDLG